MYVLPNLLPGMSDFFPPLSQLFPILTFARKADKWLCLIGQKTIRNQLAERRIKRIRVWNTIASGYITFNKTHDIVIVLNRDKPEEWFITLGHELGHTFHFNFKKFPPVSFVSKRVLNANFRSAEEKSLYNTIENFCEEFAIRWITINGYHNIQQFWDKHKNTLLLSDKYDLD